MRIISISMPSDNWSHFGLVVPCGALQDPWRLPGLAHLTEHIVTRSAKSKPTDPPLEHRIAGIGGFFDAYTTIDKTVYNFTVPVDKLHMVIATAIQMLETLEFNEMDWCNEKNVVRLQITNNFKHFDPYLEVRRLLWGRNSKMARPIIGSLNTLDKVKKSDVLRLWKRYYSVDQCYAFCISSNLSGITHQISAENVDQNIPVRADTTFPKIRFIRRKNCRLVDIDLNFVIEKISNKFCLLFIVPEFIEQILIHHLRELSGVVENVDVSIEPDPLRLRIKTSTLGMWLDPVICTLLHVLTNMSLVNDASRVSSIAYRYLMSPIVSQAVYSLAWSIVRFGAVNVCFEEDLTLMQSLAKGDGSALEEANCFARSIIDQNRLCVVIWGDYPELHRDYVIERIKEL